MAVVAIAKYKDYDPFAWLYNKHWGDRFLDAALVVFEHLIQDNLPEKGRILDLCCGTGQLARVLNERGNRIEGIDGSEKMLEYARENAPGVEFTAGDARNFTTKRKYDAVLCMFDSLNHVMSGEDLSMVFASVDKTLKERGMFLFDLNTEESYNRDWKGTSAIIEEDHVCVINSSYMPESKTGIFDATLFRSDEGWRRIDFKLTQHYYAEAEVRTRLGKAGFREIQTFAFDRKKKFGAPAGDTKRIYYFCKTGESSR
jgi:SAM-dependent methyltransferase